MELLKKLISLDNISVYETGENLRNKLLNNNITSIPEYWVHGIAYNNLEVIISELALTYKDNFILNKDEVICKLKLINSIHEMDQTNTVTIDSIFNNIVTQYVYDPNKGLRDLQNKLIRLHKNAIQNEPLSMITACKISTELDFKLHSETWFELYNHARLIRYVPLKIIGNIMLSILSLPKPSKCLKLLHETRVLEFLIPELSDCSTIIQSKRDGVHNVFDHVMYALDASENTPLIRLSVLFHDIAKPQTLQLGEDGKIHFFGHDSLGAIIARQYLKSWGFEKDFINKVYALVLHHMFDADPKLTDRAVKKLIKKIGQELIYELLKVRVADRLGSSKTISMKKINHLKKKIDRILKDV